jgi:hypothetical protein
MNELCEIGNYTTHSIVTPMGMLHIKTYPYELLQISDPLMMLEHTDF